MATETRLPMIEIVGRSDGSDPISGRFVEDPWMRLAEVHFPDDDGDGGISAVVTFEGPGAGPGGIGGRYNVSNVTGNPTDPFKIGEVVTNKGGSLGVVASWTFSGNAANSFDDLDHLLVREFDPVAHEFRFISATDILTRLQSQYPNSTQLKGTPVRPGTIEDPNSGPWFLDVVFVQPNPELKGDTYRVSYSVQLTDEEPFLTVGLHTAKLHSDFEVVNSNSVSVTAYAQQPTTNPDDPAPPLRFEPKTDGTITVTGGVQKWSFSASLPDKGSAVADAVYRFNSKGRI